MSDGLGQEDGDRLSPCGAACHDASENVDLPVERDAIPPVLAQHRLPAVHGKIQDAQAAKFHSKRGVCGGGDGATVELTIQLRRRSWRSLGHGASRGKLLDRG